MTALAVISILCLQVIPAFSGTFWWMDDDDKTEEIEPQIVAGQGIKEPFFAFVVALAEGDSLGTWSSDVIRNRLNGFGRESRFPVNEIRSLTRRPALGNENESRLHESVGRIWEMELGEDLDRPMPYSILGYHPGSLYISKRLVFSEWNLGQLDVAVPDEDGTTKSEPLEKVMIMRLDEGHIILDVDSWLDLVLGKGLDDSWTLGLALARHYDIPTGLAISVGRKEQNIFGEIDFLADKVKAHGSPLARALSRHGRTFTAPHPDKINLPWTEDN